MKSFNFRSVRISPGMSTVIAIANAPMLDVAIMVTHHYYFLELILRSAAFRLAHYIRQRYICHYVNGAYYPIFGIYTARAASEGNT